MLCSLPRMYNVPKSTLFFHPVPPHIRSAVSEHLAKNGQQNQSSTSEKTKYEGYAGLLDATRPYTCRIESFNKFANMEYIISSGSGFHITPDGLIVTDSQVVGNLMTCRVILNDGSVYIGKVEWVNERLSLAVVSIPVTNQLPVIPMSSSKDAQVVAITGVPDKEHIPRDPVTGKEPFFPIKTVSNTMDWLDRMYNDPAAIVYGHVGGMVVNRMAEAVGVAHVNNKQAPEAIPIEFVQYFLMKRQKEGSVVSHIRSPRLQGLLLFDISMSLFNEFDLPYAHFGGGMGVAVVLVEEGSPAFEAGLRTGDMITQVNDFNAKTSIQVADALTNNLQVRLTIRRRGGAPEILMPYDKWPVHDDWEWR